MQKYLLTFVIFLCPLIVYGQSTPFSRCGNLRPPQAVSFNSCRSPQQFCQVKRGGRVLSRIQFNSPLPVNRLQAYAHLKLPTGFVTWPLNEHTEACNYLTNGKECPLIENESYVYELRANFPEDAPLDVPIHVLFTIRDEDHANVLSCFRTLVTVTQ